MKKIIGFAIIFFATSFASFAQKNQVGKKIKVPASISMALYKKYPEAKKVTWEKENGNYEANWGGKSGEDNSVQFTPSGSFVEIVKAISVSDLPKSVLIYVKQHYNGAKISEAGRVTDANKKLFYEAEIHGKDVIFDEYGNFVNAGK